MANTYTTPSHGAVIDIGGSQMRDTIRDRLVTTLQCEYDEQRPPTLPDELLYDDNGLPIWNQIIFTPEFYQTHDEIALFDQHGASIVERVDPGVVIIDLGAGDTRKVEHLLTAFETAGVAATYLALDISKSSLAHNVGYLAKRHAGKDRVVTCAGIWGTFEDGLKYVQSIQSPRLFLSLGSVLCNDHWPEALKKVKGWANVLRQDDWLLVGMDAHLLPTDEEKIWAAYHSRDDLYKKFFLNGFDHANRLLQSNVFREEDWDFKAQLESTPTTRHRFFFMANKDVELPKLGRTIRKGEVVDWFDSHKFGEDSVRIMFGKAELCVDKVMQAPGSEFRQYLVKKGNGQQKLDADSAISGVH